MADSTELVDVTNQFKGLSMANLIGGPLTAACDAQVGLARATADFVRDVGFLPAASSGENAVTLGPTRTACFDFTRPVHQADGSYVDEHVSLQVPLLAIVKVPSLAIKSVDVAFDMEVKSSFSSRSANDTKGAMSGDAALGWGPFSLKVHVEGAVSTHKENTRQSDNSAKYHVQVRAEDQGMPEGLARVMDILNLSIVPRLGEARGAAQPA